MKNNTHILGGIACAAVYKTAADLPLETLPHELIYIGTAVIGSLIPDLCHPGSYVGKKTGLLSKTISKTFGHRTITHSWIMVLLVMMLPNWIDWIYEDSISKGLLLGVVSHILLDSFTSRGVQLFYPLPIRFRFPMYTKTGSKTENYIATFISLLAVVMLVDNYILPIF
jgi:inner membrane protein